MLADRLIRVLVEHWGGPQHEARAPTPDQTPPATTALPNLNVFTPPGSQLPPNPMLEPAWAVAALPGHLAVDNQQASLIKRQLVNLNFQFLTNCTQSIAE